MCREISLKRSALNKRKILKSALGVTCRFWPQAKWWLSSNDIIPIAQSVLSAEETGDKKSSPESFEILKPRAHGQSVLRLRSPDDLSASYIAKVFTLRRLKHRLKYHRLKQDRFGFAEAANLIIAAERSLNVPKVHGYGQICGACRLVKKSVVITEDLAHHVTVRELLASSKGDEEKNACVLDRTLPLFVGLYNACCNHIDVNLGSFMFSGDDSQRNDYILDFEYAQFYDKPSFEILMFEAAYFANRCKEAVTDEAIRNWQGRLLDAVDVTDKATREKLTERYHYYLDRTKPGGGILRNKDRRRIY